MREIQWFKSVAGSSHFAYVGDHKIVRIDQDRQTCYVVQRCNHGMPTEAGHTFDYLDDALSWIGA